MISSSLMQRISDGISSVPLLLFYIFFSGSEHIEVNGKKVQHCACQAKEMKHRMEILYLGSNAVQNCPYRVCYAAPNQQRNALWRQRFSQRLKRPL